MTECHFELTEESKLAFTGEKVFRIRAIRDIPERFVKAGDLGGWVSSVYTSTSELRIGPHAWVADDAIIAGDAYVAGNALVYDHAFVFGQARVTGSARVHGKAQVCDDAVVQDCARVHDSAVISGQARISGDATISGKTEVTDHAHVSGKTQVGGESNVYENAQIAGNARVYDSSVHENSRVDQDATLFLGSTLFGDALVSGSAQLRQTTVREHAIVTGGDLTGCCIEGNARVAASLPERAILSGTAEVLKEEQCEVFQPLGVRNCAVTVARTQKGKAGVWAETFETDAGRSQDVRHLKWHLVSQGLGRSFRENIKIAKRRVVRDLPEEPAQPLCFELTDIAKTLDDGTTVYRICAVRDIDVWCVSAGDLGGWVPNTHTPEGIPRIGPDSWLADDAMILGNAYITGDSFVADQACIRDNVVVDACGRVLDKVVVSGDSRVHGGIVFGRGELTGCSYVGEKAHLEVVGKIPDACINSTTDHRRFGPTVFNTEIFLTRQQGGTTLIMARTCGRTKTGTLDELLPENPIQYQEENPDLWEGFPTLLDRYSDGLRELAIAENTTLRRLITVVLKEWDL
ncbi:hypothetical protein CMUST_07225 [Corynebacterium mustelae]|uniref:Acyltransferase family protein n=1 Tax=Corynebacterium mustelae TaxID=571915 RepID=A0A0G3GZ33_9CORY|nr:hypothetical protein [Corynebacterium mustelae]AKK05775.1 hypothetical protein CMUST_07225 [Corynebacterium mustelae]